MADNKTRKRKKAKAKAKSALGRVLPIFVAIILIVVIIIAAYGKKIYEKYSYAGDVEELTDYFNLYTEDEIAIIYNHEHLETRALYKEGKAYLPMDLVRSNFTKHFYEGEGVLYYTTAKDIITVNIDEDYHNYTINKTEMIDTDFDPAVHAGDETYIAIDYLKLFVDMRYTLHNEELPVYMTIEDSKLASSEIAAIMKDTMLRHRGGVKSEIIEKLPKGSTVYVLEELEDWAKVVEKESGLIGYVEIKKYEYIDTAYAYFPDEIKYPLEYTSISHDGKINMAFHQVFGDSGSSRVAGATAASSTINVVAPTWFRITSELGGIENISDREYVDIAHSKGMQVWAVWTDVDYTVDTTTLFTTANLREGLIDTMIDYTLKCGADGINIDFEKISGEAGSGFVEFLRELSIKTHANGIVLSVDNYSPTASTSYYNRGEQGNVCDYVIVMGYDEHWGGSQTAGSVASIGYVEDGIVRTIDEGVPASKLINAIPFYTRLWKTTGGTVASENIGMDMAANWVSENGVVTDWSAEMCQNYGEIEKDGTLYQIWLEDADSIETKLSVMDTHECAGVAEWKLGFENSNVWSVIDAYVNR